MNSPERVFHSLRYLRSNSRRLEHLARLELPIASRSVLEIGAGIGDLTSFFLDRGCTVTSTEPRAENVATFRTRFTEDPLWPPERLHIVQSDVESLKANGVGAHQVVFCYQVLNQTGDPEPLLEMMSELCTELLLLECATLSGRDRHREVLERRTGDANDPGGSLDGRGCVPSRPWIFSRLKRLFEHVYMPLEQPAFDRFKTDWRTDSEGRAQHRAIFIASRSPLQNSLLVENIPDVHLS
jgi:hypothetical protein